MELASHFFDIKPPRDQVKKRLWVKGAKAIVGLWNGDVLAGSEEDIGQSNDVWDKVGELALRVLGEN